MKHVKQKYRVLELYGHSNRIFGAHAQHLLNADLHPTLKFSPGLRVIISIHLTSWFDIFCVRN